MLIGEHGRYPRNARGQTLYPRYEFFQQILHVFRRSGRSVPVFNDKHLSWKWEWAKSMVDAAHELEFPLMAGSSLPVTWRIPSVDLPWGAEIDEIVCIGYGGIDSYDFHGLEALQCLAERRRGGETGVGAVQALRGPGVWKALAESSWPRGGCSPALVEACLCRSFTLASPRSGYGHVLPDPQERARIAHDPFMYRLEYSDGVKATLLMLSGLVSDFTVAVCDEGPGPGALDPDVPAGIEPGPDFAELLQSPGPPHRDHVPDREAPLPRRANPADHGRSGRGDRLAEPGPVATRHASPGKDRLPGTPRIDLPEELSRCDLICPPRRLDPRAQPPAGPCKTMAIVTTVWTYLSHAQHMGDRFLVGYPFEGRWHRPAIDVVALTSTRSPKATRVRSCAASFGFQVYPTIAQALRRGGPKLAVDAVLIIGEHGDYPTNEKGQILYPRYEFFRQVADVFEADGRAVPVFNDKHLSYSFTKAKAMVDASKRLGFPFLAGSSLPVTWRLPPVELPFGCEIEDALMVGVGGSDPMDFHALEAMQCMLERRRGGETGVRRVQLVQGDAVWKAGDAKRWSWELLESALSRSDSLQGLTVLDGRTQNLAGGGAIKALVRNPSAYFLEYLDGTRATLLMLDGALLDYNFAARVRGMPDPISCQFLLPPTPNVAYSTRLMHQVETMIETGSAPYPVERTLLVSGILESCLDSKHQGSRLLDTPHLAVRYQPPRDSTFCRS